VNHNKVSSSPEGCAKARLYSIRHRIEPASHGVTLPFRVFVQVSLAPVSVRCSPLVLGRRRTSGFLRDRASNATRESNDGILSWACALLQSASKLQRPLLPRSRARRNAHDHELTAAPPMRFAPLQRLPTQGSGMMTGFASPGRLRLQVFSTSWRLDPPRACRPCFMPDPLLGLHPPEPCSSRAAVRCLQRLSPHVVRRIHRTCSW
jgi:hypothetical protein